MTVSKQHHESNRPGKPFFKHLPQWIYDDPGYEDLNGQAAWLLHLMSGQADEGIDDGPRGDRSRRGCRFGDACIATAKLSDSTVRKYTALFASLGFIIKVGQGGGQGSTNEYAIPRRRGALDHLRIDDDPRYKTNNTRREKQGNTRRQIPGKNEQATNIPAEARANTRRDSRQYPPRDGASHSIHREHKEIPAAAAAVDSNKTSNPDPILEALILAGITGTARSELAALPGITPELIRDKEAWCRENGKRGGVLIQELRSASEQAQVRARKRAASQQRADEQAKAQHEVERIASELRDMNEDDLAAIVAKYPQYQLEHVRSSPTQQWNLARDMYHAGYQSTHDRKLAELVAGGMSLAKASATLNSDPRDMVI